MHGNVAMLAADWASASGLRWNPYARRTRQRSHPDAVRYLIDQNNDIVGEAIDINVIAFVFEELLNTENASVGLPNHVLPILLTDAIVAYRGSHVTNVESHDSATGIVSQAR